MITLSSLPIIGMDFIALLSSISDMGINIGFFIGFLVAFTTSYCCFGDVRKIYKK